MAVGVPRMLADKLDTIFVDTRPLWRHHAADVSAAPTIDTPGTDTMPTSCLGDASYDSDINRLLCRRQMLSGREISFDRFDMAPTAMRAVWPYEFLAPNRGATFGARLE